MFTTVRFLKPLMIAAIMAVALAIPLMLSTPQSASADVIQPEEVSWLTIQATQAQSANIEAMLPDIDIGAGIAEGATAVSNKYGGQLTIVIALAIGIPVALGIIFLVMGKFVGFLRRVFR